MSFRGRVAPSAAVDLDNAAPIVETGVAMSDFDRQKFHRKIAETKNLERLWKCQLRKYLQYFIDARQRPMAQTQPMRYDREDRIKSIGEELKHRRARKPSFVQVAALIIAVIGLFGLQKCLRPSSTPREARPTPTATPQQSATPQAFNL